MIRRTLKWSSLLGWRLDSNWTEPWLFAIYVLIKPLASSLLLVFMYYAVRQVNPERVPTAFLPFMYIGNACFMQIGAIMFGMSHTLLSDREHYRMLKYIYISPGHFRSYFVGRSLSGGVQAMLGAAINIGIGAAMFPELREALLRYPTPWFYLAACLIIGTVLLLALGLILSAIVMNMSRQGGYVSEGISGVMYLSCGVVFPLGVLPNWLQGVGMILPPTYWLEAMRRAILGPPDAALPASPLTSWSDGELLLGVTISTLLLGVFALWLFRWSERRAWRNGRIEETTGA